jgi:hypothetical protein
MINEIDSDTVIWKACFWPGKPKAYMEAEMNMAVTVNKDWMKYIITGKKNMEDDCNKLRRLELYKGDGRKFYRKSAVTFLRFKAGRKDWTELASI